MKNIKYFIILLLCTAFAFSVTLKSDAAISPSYYLSDFSCSDLDGKTVISRQVSCDSGVRGVCIVAAKYNGNTLEDVKLDFADDSATDSLSVAVDNTEGIRVFTFASVDNMKPLDSVYTPPGNCIFNEDFECDIEDYSIPFVTAIRDNTIELAPDGDSNTAVHFKRTSGNTSDFHMDCKPLWSNASCSVYEFDIRFVTNTESMSINIKDDNAKYSTIARWNKYGYFTLSTSTLGKVHTIVPEKDRYYRVAIVYDYANRLRDFYLDGKCVLEDIPFESEFASGGTRPTLLRFHATSTTTSDTLEFYVDNIKAYDCTVPVGDDELSKYEKHIVMSSSHSIFSDYDSSAAENVLNEYESSPLKGVHPRIHASKSDFEKIKSEIATNSYKKSWYNNVMAGANSLLNDETPLKYELRDGVRLLYVSRDCLKNMYVLGFAYQITGDEKYARRAWIDLEAVSSFPDWHPTHDIDVGEMCAAVAIGYDWMYDAFSAEQRAIIEKGIRNNGFYQGVLAYQSANAPLSGIYSMLNHNIVINGGMTLAAIAFMDVYPGFCGYTVANAVGASEKMMTMYGPDGAWPEGPGYWEYATQYAVKMMSSLDRVFSHSFGLENTAGMNGTAAYALSHQSDVGMFGYGDGSDSKQLIPEMFWLGNEYGDKSVTEAVLTLGGGTMSNLEDRILSMLWYDTAITAGDVTFPLDKCYSRYAATFRDEWKSSGTTFAAIHTGYTSRRNGYIIYHTQLDGGTFVYDWGGVRWTYNSSSTPYDLPQTASYGEYGDRWKLFKSRAESHSTLVINPDSGPDQNVLSESYVSRFESGETQALAVAELSDVYRNNASSVRRGFLFTDNRTSLVIRDEIEVLKESEIYWFMQTDATVSVNGNTAILTKNGKSIKLEIISDCGGELSTGKSEPLPTSPVISGDVYQNCTRIQFKLSAKTDATITAKLTPLTVDGSDISEYDIDIDNWSVN